MALRAMHSAGFLFFEEDVGGYLDDVAKKVELNLFFGWLVSMGYEDVVSAGFVSTHETLGFTLVEDESCFRRIPLPDPSQNWHHYHPFCLDNIQARK